MKTVIEMALGKIKSARDCHPNAVDTLLFEAEEILEGAIAEQEPVAAECKFDREQKWVRCEIAHHNLVQSEPHNWPGYQTRLLYTSPQPAQQQPAFHGFMDEERCCVNICYTPWAPGGPNNELPTAYYTSPPAQRKPLTHEQTMDGYKLACSYGVYESNAFALTEKMFSIFKENT